MDQNKLSQVIRNLISNALKFCQKPGIVNVEVDVVPVSAYADLNANTSHSSNRSKANKWNFRSNNQVTIEVAPENIASAQETDSNYYIRLSVIDDGAGISEVYLYGVLLLVAYYLFYYSLIFTIIIGKPSQVI